VGICGKSILLLPVVTQTMIKKFTSKIGQYTKDFRQKRRDSGLV